MAEDLSKAKEDYLYFYKKAHKMIESKLGTQDAVKFFLEVLCVELVLVYFLAQGCLFLLKRANFRV